QPELLPSVPTRHHCTSDSGMWYLAEMSFASACGPESVTGGVRSPDPRRKPAMRRLRCDLRPAARPTVSPDFPYGPRSMNMGDMLPDRPPPAGPDDEDESRVASQAAEFAATLAAFEGAHPAPAEHAGGGPASPAPKVGQRLRCRIVSVSEDSLLLDI